MGIILESTSLRCGKVFLILAIVAVVLSEVSSKQRKLDCRKFVFAPPCRGIAAKRDTRSHTNSIRMSPSEENDYLALADGQKMSSSDDDFDTVNGILGLLKRVMSKNLEYDTSNNYLA